MKRIITKCKHHPILWASVFVLGWPKSLFGVFHKILQKNPNKLFGQPNIICIYLEFNIEENKISHWPLLSTSYTLILYFFKIFSLCIWESRFRAFLKLFPLIRIALDNSLAIFFPLFP